MIRNIIFIFIVILRGEFFTARSLPRLPHEVGINRVEAPLELRERCAPSGILYIVA